MVTHSPDAVADITTRNIVELWGERPDPDCHYNDTPQRLQTWETGIEPRASWRNTWWKVVGDFELDAALVCTQGHWGAEDRVASMRICPPGWDVRAIANTSSGWLYEIFTSSGFLYPRVTWSCWQRTTPEVALQWLKAAEFSPGQIAHALAWEPDHGGERMAADYTTGATL